MADSSPVRRVERIVSTHDLSWLLELERRGQLDLNPSYQRRSVWTPRDRRFFMDTIFQNFPSPAIFLHKTIELTSGSATYHVVDGKQRITTILLFLNNKVYLPHDMGDSRFAGKRWRDFAKDDDAMARLWSYRITTEEIDEVTPHFVNEVFQRINKNARSLTPQELRHARFDGYLISFLEEEVLQEPWKVFKIYTTAKIKRMADVQNLAELAAVVIRSRVSGFDQEDLDLLFAEHDQVEEDLDEGEVDFDSEAFESRFREIRDWLVRLEQQGEVVSTVAQPFLHFYTLWCFLAGHQLDSLDVTEFAARYRRFMEQVSAASVDTSLELRPEEPVDVPTLEQLVIDYKLASVGATTEQPKRQARLDALTAALSED